MWLPAKGLLGVVLVVGCVGYFAHFKYIQLRKELDASHNTVGELRVHLAHYAKELQRAKEMRVCSGVDAGAGADVVTTGKLRYTILILAFNRSKSLKRLFNSLAAADYAGERVNLEISVDFPVNASDSMAMEYKSCRDYAVSFTWPHGYKRVLFRMKNIGLKFSWLQAWYPNTDDDIGIVNR